MKPLHHKKHTLAKRGLSLLCILALCLGLLPVTALAAGIPYLDENGTQRTAASATQVTNSDTQWTNGWYVAQGDITIDQPVTVSDNVHLILEDGCNLTVNGGILLTQGSNMYIYAQSTEKETMGSLTATGTDAGIKEANYGTPSLTITGGKITAIGRNTGISADSLTITDGYVSASVNGYYGNSISVRTTTISGGFVDLYGDFNGTLSTGTDGHAVISSTGEINNIAADCKGLFLIQNEGKIYGDTFTLTQDLNIAVSNIRVTVGKGQTLTLDHGVTLTIPPYATLTNNGILNNNGSIINTGTLNNIGTLNNNGTLNNTSALNNAGTIINNGTLTGEVGGSGTVTPKITTDSPLPKGTVGQSYTASLEATGNNITWSSSDKPKWMTLSSTGVISGTPTTADTYTFTVTATNASGSDSKELTLTINPAPILVTGVTLDQAELALYTGDTATLSATVTPENATNKSLTWSSDNQNVATVENGKVTAKAAGTATITVTTEDGEKTATCTVTVTDKTYTISADTTALDFGSAYTGYTQPAAQTVTVKNTGNQRVTLVQPTADNYVIGMLSATTLEPNATATFTVQPKAGLAPGNYDENILITGSSSASASVATSFTVRERPYIPPTPPSVSEETIDAINDAEPGETVSVALKDGDTTLDAEVFETLAGRDITLEIALEGGVTWTVNGQDIPADANLDDLDLGVEMDSDGIPVDVVNSITGERDTVQMTLAHNGEFGFTMTLTAPLGKENAGYWANLYHYDEDAEALNFEAAAKIDEDGSVTIPFSHASQYAIVIDTHSHATVDVSDLFSDIAPDAWYKDAIQYAYDHGLMTGVSDTEFAPEATTTRAMIVSILARLEGVESAQAAGFADVDDEWYATAVNWAASVGVVNGYEDNTFRPNTAITREQLAAILMNYAAYKGYDVSARADLSHYSDADSISSWANDVLLWAVAEGLLTGVTDDTIAPQAHATRAQVAAILQRFLSE